jgi:hypothetical protein
MVERERIREEPAHEVVLAKLLDIQARLRGEPASAVPATRPIAVHLPERVAVVHGEMTILSEEPEDIAEAKVAALQARLARLEEVIEEAGLVSEETLAFPNAGATVTALPDATSTAADEDRSAD